MECAGFLIWQLSQLQMLHSFKRLIQAVTGEQGGGVGFAWHRLLHWALGSTKILHGIRLLSCEQAQIAYVVEAIPRPDAVHSPNTACMTIWCCSTSVGKGRAELLLLLIAEMGVQQL